MFKRLKNSNAFCSSGIKIDPRTLNKVKVTRHLSCKIIPPLHIFLNNFGEALIRVLEMNGFIFCDEFPQSL